jgi:serine/threonine protein kinase
MDTKAATERVGRYQLLEPIGGGPNGMVSRAKVFGVAGFERQFAVKRFAPDLTVGPVAQALSAAARSYGSLEHPRIARMSEFGVAQGQTFTAVEYVAGLDAFRLLQEAKLAGVAIAPGGALALVSQAARAVGYAHGRGLSHLGLAPTNVIVTVEGDVKVTDFGILAATMPGRPTESPRLAHRIPYLAPEQLASESTSAATDVFVLGVIAYELVTGQRAYRGETPAQIAHAILGGPPAEPPLPRPIVRVLQRCLARSPFERFPDARALADALDAALRVAPVPGTRKDIGAQIKVTLDRYASLNEGNLSGMVALNLQSTPVADRVPTSTGDDYVRENARTDVSPVVPSAGLTLQEIPKVFSTVAGLAPPPIPVPPGVASPPSVPPTPPGVPAKTILGLAGVAKPKVPGVIPPIGKPPIPSIKPVSKTTPPPVPSSPAEDVIEEPSGLIEVTDVATLVRDTPPPDADDSGKMPAVDPATMQGMGPGVLPAKVALRPPSTGENFESQTGEMSPGMLDELHKRSVKTTGELATVPRPQEIPTQLPLEAPPRDSFTGDRAAAFANELKAAAAVNTAASATSSESSNEATNDASREPIATAQTMLAVPTPIVPPPGTATAEPSGVVIKPAPPAAARPTAKRSKTPLVIIAVLATGGVAGAGFFAFSTMDKNGKPVDKAVDKGSAEKGSAEKGSAAVAKVTIDAGVAAVAPRDAALAVTATIDAAAVATTTIDAAVEKPVEVVKPTAASDKLQITSKPAGARVFIDGADQGVTPLKLAGSADRHTMVLLAPGHDLYIGEVDGHGVFEIQLKPVTPSGGHAGIKVIKCKAKERYYVYVDGQPTGMTCPTERIDTVVGPHTVEVYDIVTDSRRKFDIVVKDERLSARVRIDD